MDFEGSVSAKERPWEMIHKTVTNPQGERAVRDQITVQWSVKHYCKRDSETNPCEAANLMSSEGVQV